MKNKGYEELVNLFNNFIREEQSSSFAVKSLLNQTVEIINRNTKDNSEKEKEATKEV